MPLPQFDSIGDVVAFNNVKAFGDAGSNLPLQGSQNYSTHNNRMGVLSESIQAMWATRMAKADPAEAISVSKMLTGRESMGVAEAITLAQQMAKTAQTTPPVTTGL